MSSQNSFLTKYSKSNSHSQDSQKINEALEWLNEKNYKELQSSFILAVGVKEFLDKGFIPLPSDDNRIIALLPVALYAFHLRSLEHIKNLESNSYLDEEGRDTVNKYKAFFSIFEAEIRDATCICDNKIVTIDGEVCCDIKEVARKIVIEFLNEVDIGNKVKFCYPDERHELFVELLIVLAILRIYRNRNIFILDEVIFTFFPKFIAILGTGAFNGFLDFPSLVGKVFPEIIDTINEGLDLDCY